MKIEIKIDDELIQTYNTEVSFTIPSELFDFIKILEMGARKYDADNWLTKGIAMSNKECHGSIFRHVAESYCGSKADVESGYHPLLHAAARSMMMYTLHKKGISHEKM